MKSSKLKRRHTIPRPNRQKTKKKKTKKKKKGAIPLKLYPSLGSTPTIPEERSKELAARLDSVSSKHKRNRTRMTQLAKYLNKKKKKGKTRGGTKLRRKKYLKRNI